MATNTLPGSSTPQIKNGSRSIDQEHGSRCYPTARNRLLLMDTRLLNLVPIGEDNATSVRVIWQRYGTWSMSGIKGKLNRLVSMGLIERKRLEVNSQSMVSVYFRAPAVTDGGAPDRPG